MPKRNFPILFPRKSLIDFTNDVVVPKMEKTPYLIDILKSFNPDNPCVKVIILNKPACMGPTAPR